MYEMPTSVRSNDLTYYANVTTSSGPAMTWGMFATGWFELGQPEKANPCFNRSYANIQPPFDVWTETPTGGAVNFITGAGGFLQLIINGLSGLRIHQTELIFNPTLPNGVESLTIRNFNYLGNQVTFNYDSNNMYVSVPVINTQNPLFIRVNHSTTVITLTQTVQKFPVSYAEIFTNTSALSK